MHITAPWGALGSEREAPHSTEVLNRFSAQRPAPGAVVGVLAVIAVAAQLAALAPIVFGDAGSAPAYRIVFRLIGGAFTACGLIAWRRRPDSRSGLLMVATGFGLLIEPIYAEVDPSALRTVGDLFEDAWGIPIIALLLTFLTGGRLQTRVDRVLVGTFVAVLGLEIPRHFFLDREGNFLLVHAGRGRRGRPSWRSAPCSCRSAAWPWPR